MTKTTMLAVVLGLALHGIAGAQSSSLYVTPEGQPQQPARPRINDGTQPIQWMSSSVATTSLTAVRMPEPKVVAMHDLVTIVVRESVEADSSSSLETKRKFDQKAEISDIPRLRLMNEFMGLLSATDLTDKPKLGVSAKSDFKGEGDYNRRDSLTTRITGRVVDVKPNGTVVIEARKFIKSDKESLTMILTGTARVRDISVDNTILSTQIYDLHLEKTHTGELRNASKKGVFTKVLEKVFNF